MGVREFGVFPDRVVDVQALAGTIPSITCLAHRNRDQDWRAAD